MHSVIFVNHYSHYPCVPNVAKTNAWVPIVSFHIPIEMQPVWVLLVLSVISVKPGSVIRENVFKRKIRNFKWKVTSIKIKLILKKVMHVSVHWEKPLVWIVKEMSGHMVEDYFNVPLAIIGFVKMINLNTRRVVRYWKQRPIIVLVVIDWEIGLVLDVK